jgi:hypothetical protein
VLIGIFTVVADETPAMHWEGQMRNLQRSEKSIVKRTLALGAIVAALSGVTACAHAMTMMGMGARRPAATEFGFGPRPSARGLYVATLEPARQLRPRQMQTVRIAIVDEAGRPVEGASLGIDGGMPQHGHGLPTRPRMTRAIEGGTYEVEGVRFSMGGWWVFKVTIHTARGADTVTFNLGL